ncbi:MULTISPECIES: RNA-guided endonuclease TnpB family protein [Acinetobacter]|uniref:Transposase n=3 Tax=Acinetobacter indicus TaxID=756892 RepID=A0A7S6VQG3_9GAMM|nr:MULTISPECIES: RNA-guided endonuclease TnpB family protein [Acinetobacter]QOW42900.1 transposase [Acinetobacter indicus]
MLTGIRLRVYPTEHQKLILSQWMGCARFVWNAKCDEDKYFRGFARKFATFDHYYETQDQKYAHFKSDEISSWLANCPSTIQKNSTVNWFNTLKKSIKGVCGRPRRKKKSDKGSVHLTSDLFEFRVENNKRKLFIGGKKFNIGALNFKAHAEFKEPKSIHISKERGQYFVSFCYEDGVEIQEFDGKKFDAKKYAKRQLDHLQDMDESQLQKIVVGIDRGVTIPVHAGHEEFDFSKEQKNHMSKADRYIKRLQRKLARQIKGSNRRAKTKHRIAVHHSKKANIRKDFAHKTSRSLANGFGQVFIFEKLNTKQMTKKPNPKKDKFGRFIPNKAKAKAGLNKAILNVGWHRISEFLTYKSVKLGKAVFTVHASYTSQECASCGHTHPDNRKSQDRFKCVSCGHADNADHNASIVIKNRAIKLVLDCGTQLDGNYLSSSGRGGVRKTTRGVKASFRSTVEASKEMCAT